MIQGAVQGNNPDAGFPVNSLCSILINSSATSYLGRLVDYAKTQGGCVDVDTYGDVEVAGADRSWTWQTCIEYGFFQTDTLSQIFGNTLGLNFFTDICKKVFRDQFTNVPDVNLTNYRFGGLKQDQSSWIMFSNGLQDPWGSNLGINVPLSPNLFVSLSTSAHCAAYHQPNSNDPSNLIQSRLEIKQFVRDALNRNP